MNHMTKERPITLTHPLRALDLVVTALGAKAATEEARMAPIARDNFIFPN
jgi:hypothetical protein